ncbi:MAG: hypothetical protein KKA42_14035 [candidate division Zixibacteria bacterium]|nr:hypothetical protein [candidate division Zixibacteria bacterium]
MNGRMAVTVAWLCLMLAGFVPGSRASARTDSVETTDSTLDPHSTYLRVWAGIVAPSHLDHRAGPRLTMRGGYAAGATLDFRSTRWFYIGATLDYFNLKMKENSASSLVFWGLQATVPIEYRRNGLQVWPSLAFGLGAFNNLPMTDDAGTELDTDDATDHLMVKVSAICASLSEARPGFLLELLALVAVDNQTWDLAREPKPLFALRIGVSL